MPISNGILTSTGSVPHLPELNLHCRSAFIACLSTSFPRDWTTAGFFTLPFLSTVSYSRVMALFYPPPAQLSGGVAGGLETTFGGFHGGFCGDSCFVGVADWSFEFWASAEQVAPSSTPSIVTITIRICRTQT